MKTIKFCCLCLLSGCEDFDYDNIGGVHPEHFQGEAKTESDADLHEELQQALRAAHTHGFEGSIGVARGGKIIFAEGVGVCNREFDQSCTSKTVYDIGSLTKPVTAMAIADMAAQGLLQTEDALGLFIPELTTEKEQLTIHQLLTHSSGLPNSAGEDYDRWDFSKFLERTQHLPEVATPGSEFHYSNIGYSYLAKVIESISGLSYEEYLRERFFGPAQMLQSGYVLPDWDSYEVAVGYHGKNEKKTWGQPHEKPMAEDGAYWNLRGNGGLMSSVDDMLKWHLHLRSGSPTPNLHQHMFEDYVVESPIAHYAYGMLVIDSDVGRVAFHDGSNDVFYSRMFWFQELDLFVIGMTNAQTEQRADAILEMAQIAAGFEPDDQAITP